MVKKKIKKKTTKTKTHKLSDINLGPQKFIKKYPGFIIAIIFAIIVLSLLLTTIQVTDPQIEDELTYAGQMHMENVFFVEETTLTVSAELDGNYEDTLEDDYLISILGDIKWFSEMEENIYTSKPTKDLFVKEIAVAAFRSRMIELNEQFVFDVFGFDQEYTIQLALEKESLPTFVTEEELNEVFEDNEADKKLFLETLDKIISDYLEEKKRVIMISSSTERQFVEAKKIILLSY
jgi:hypothetical protein